MFAGYADQCLRQIIARRLFCLLYGLTFGGSNLDGPKQSYIYFVIAQKGTFQIRHRSGDQTMNVAPRATHAAIAQPDASGKSTNTLEVRVDGMSSLSSLRFHVRGRILVPQGRSLEVDFPAGELSIRGVRGDLNVDAGAGEISIVIREADVRSVRLGVGIGEASLSVAGRNIEGSGWLGQKVRWGEGAGASRVAVNLGVGELGVTLD